MPLIDFYKWNKKVWDRAYSIIDIEQIEEFSPRIKKIMYFISYKATPFLMNLASFLGLIYLMNRVVQSKGIEGLAVLFMAIYIMTKKWGGQEESRKKSFQEMPVPKEQQKKSKS